MLKAIKIRLYPTTQQEEYINSLLGSYRFVFNQCLNLKKTKYIEENVSIGLKDLGKFFHQELTKNPEYIWLQEHNTKVLKQSVIDLLDSYKRFFVNGNGFPRFKTKHNNNQSCRFPIETISKKNDYLTNKISLANIKNVKFSCSDKYVNQLNTYKENIKSGTLSKTKSGKYFFSLLLDIPEIKVLTKTDKVVGIDLGIKDFIVTSDNVKFKNIKIKRNNEEKLKRLNRRLSKKQKGSKNREKVRLRLAKFHERINNKKENYLHHTTNQLLNENQVIVIENLNIKGMLKNHNLAKSIQEVSLSRFKTMLKYKAKWYGRDIIEIDRFYPSSKLCSCCGNKNTELKLSDRGWKCKKCNTYHDRDLNAAINIRNEGIRLLKNNIPIRYGKLKLEDYPLMDDKDENPLKSNGRLIQEKGTEKHSFS
jgi:putative transposase